jgi:reactive intermediate/imine deaminase
MTPKTQIRTHNASPAAAPYSQGVRKGPVLQTSGQISTDPATNQLLHIGDVASQTTQALTNTRAVLEAGGATFDDVVLVRIYITKRSDYGLMNAAYSTFVDAHTPSGVLPSRTTVITDLADENLLVEIDALAVVED